MLWLEGMLEGYLKIILSLNPGIKSQSMPTSMQFGSSPIFFASCRERLMSGRSMFLLRETGVGNAHFKN